MNALVALENQLQPLAPRFAQVLGNTMPVERLMRTVMISVERLPALLDCDRQSIFNAAMSAACLGLEVDGVTGQAYLIPFKGKAQLVIGYKGYNTLAARSGITIGGGVVREGDVFEYELGSNAFARHVPKLGNKGRIVGAYATATAKDRPAVVCVLDIDELNAVKNKSPGAKRSDSPWNDPAIGFPAMCEKTAKRRLARSLPLNIMHLAARLDEAVDEQGQGAWISPDKSVVLEGEIIAPRHNTNTPSATELISPRHGSDAGEAAASAITPSPKSQAGAADYIARWNDIIRGATNADQLAAKWNAEADERKTIAWPEGEFVKLQKKVKTAIDSMKAPA